MFDPMKHTENFLLNDTPSEKTTTDFFFYGFMNRFFTPNCKCN